jgi:hypothetical protein
MKLRQKKKVDWRPKDPIDEWIASVVPGCSFADVGGIGLDSVNERISTALANAASRAAMVDIRPASYHEWDVFRDVLAKKLHEGAVEEFPSVDINDLRLAERVGTYDVVNCTGILYHLPSPLHAFDNLAKIVERHLVINTVTMPETIENEAGVLRLEGSAALFLPGISEQDRSVLSLHYERKFGWSIDDYVPAPCDQATALMPWREDGEFSCWPYWWLLTDQAFRAVVELMGFSILDEWKWEDHALHLFAERRDRPSGEQGGLLSRLLGRRSKRRSMGDAF